MGISLGLAIGVALGSVPDNRDAGMAMGIVLILAVGNGLDARTKREEIIF